MSIAAILARLNPATANQHIPGGAGPILSAHDIAAALGMCNLPDGARHLARAKWAAQEEYVRPLHISLYENVMADDGDQWIRLRSHIPGLIFDLTRLAVHEYCGANICSACKGTKYADIGGRRVACTSCGGSGFTGKHSSARARAETLGIAWGTYHRIWSQLYNRCLVILSGWDGLVLGAVKKRIWGDNTHTGVTP